jgi:SAM-dependent methyltransferase
MRADPHRSDGGDEWSWSRCRKPPFRNIAVLEDPREYRAIWEQKGALREVYADIYRRILKAVVGGSILEIGGGSGNFKAYAPSTTSSDILYAPWLDLVCDAQRLPFATESFANVIMIDVLHHIEYPVRALAEILRVLQPGGRLIFCEPAITPLSGIFYRLFHHEPVDMSAAPLRDGPISVDKNPFHSNQAIPTLLVGTYRQALATKLPTLELQDLDYFSFLAYPLSGGFRSWSALTPSIAAWLLRAEWRLRRILGPVAAFRLLAAYRKTQNDSHAACGRWAKK